MYMHILLHLKATVLIFFLKCGYCVGVSDTFFSYGTNSGSLVSMLSLNTIHCSENFAFLPQTLIS